DQVTDVRHPDPLDGRDDVPAFDTRLCGPGPWLHGDDERTRLAALGGRPLDAENGPFDGLAGDDVLGEVVGDFDRDGETDTDVASGRGGDRDVESDHLTVPVR